MVKHVKGPMENLFRPSIDVLFRSAAVSFGNRCVGILLTGRLCDGTAGLAAIKNCGGLTVIENPETAEFAEMPSAALNEITIDYIFDIDKFSEGISDICLQPLPAKRKVSERLKKESKIANSIKSQINVENSLGEQVPLSCASCGGPLWKMDDERNVRYRCHVGHSFSEEALLHSQNHKLEETLWVSLRTFEEKKILLGNMAKEYEGKGFNSLASSYQKKIEEVNRHIEVLRALMQTHN